MTHQEVQGKKSLPKWITPPPKEQNSWTLTVITQKNEATLHSCVSHQEQPLCDNSRSITSRFFFFFAASVLRLRKHWVTPPFAGAQTAQSLNNNLYIILIITAPNNNNNNSSVNSQELSFSVKYTISALIIMGNAWKHNPKWKTKQNKTGDILVQKILSLMK